MSNVPAEADRAAEFLPIGVKDVDFAVDGVEVDGPPNSCTKPW